MSILEELRNEITSHPREREGFNNIELNSLKSPEREDALDLLITHLEEGDERLTEPTKKILGHDYVKHLQSRLTELSTLDHGSIYIPYFLFKETGEQKYIQLMKSAILKGDKDWDMRRSALGRNLRNELSPKMYAEFCIEIAKNDSNKSVLKTALLGIQCYTSGRNEFALNDDSEEVLKLLTSVDKHDRDSGLKKLESMHI
ncbi:hypothetical protein QWY82_18920 [Simiduia curdlanivorans]|uniref:HEAT repeat domain-containing protein n=1 Tax=Simiduia curdlanivorans TaxID=1492769 RepID=A0ABV8V544_9GAMM|nr:hypothetical protein [Simiduia curdlanivorans]MDN3640880.1 hypothetical protein [Simiduia curdlanivorans]